MNMEEIVEKLGKMNERINECVGRASVSDPAIRDILLAVGCDLDDVINDLQDMS